MLATIILSFVGGIFLLTGFCIWWFKLPGVVAGYDPEQVSDPEGLAVWTGKALMLNGVVMVLIGLINFKFQSGLSEELSYVALMVLSLVAAVLTLIGLQKYLK